MSALVVHLRAEVMAVLDDLCRRCGASRESAVCDIVEAALGIPPASAGVAALPLEGARNGSPGNPYR